MSNDDKNNNCHFKMIVLTIAAVIITIIVFRLMVKNLMTMLITIMKAIIMIIDKFKSY